METRTGVLRVTSTNSRLGGVLLAVCGAEGDPFSAATGLLGNLNLRNNDPIIVRGKSGTINNVQVFCITDAQRGSHAID